MNQQQISYFVSIKKGRPDQNLLPPNTPKQVKNSDKLANKIDGVLLGRRS